MNKQLQMELFLKAPEHKLTFQRAAVDIVTFAKMMNCSEDECLNYLNIGIRAQMELMRDDIYKNIDEFERNTRNPDGTINWNNVFKELEK